MGKDKHLADKFTNKRKSIKAVNHFSPINRIYIKKTKLAVNFRFTTALILLQTTHK